jgi:uronate dehydrogenase
MSVPFSKTAEPAPSILVTGSAGTVGRVLANGWEPGRFEGFDLPDGDARDRGALTEAARGHDAIVHLAWDTETENFRSGALATDNLAMAHNALEAATRAGVPRVLLASSVHADAFWPPPDSPLDPSSPPTPDSPYGASKVFLEALGRHFAAHRGLEVVAIRLGGVNAEDEPPEDPSERSVWLPHGDLLDMVRTSASARLGPNRFALVVAVGDGPHRIHSYGEDPLWKPA